jgi:hypothetical protein
MHKQHLENKMCCVHISNAVLTRDGQGRGGAEAGDHGALLPSHSCSRSSYCVTSLRVDSEGCSAQGGGVAGRSLQDCLPVCPTALVIQRGLWLWLWLWLWALALVSGSGSGSGSSGLSAGTVIYGLLGGRDVCAESARAMGGRARTKEIRAWLAFAARFRVDLPRVAAAGWLPQDFRRILTHAYVRLSVRSSSVGSA